MLDTSEEIQIEYYGRLRELTPEERLEKTFSLIRGLSELSISALQSEFPEASYDEIVFLFAKKLHGLAIAEKYFPFDESATSTL